MVNNEILGAGIESESTENEQFDKAAEILDLCGMQLGAIINDINGTTTDLVDTFFALSASADAMKQELNNIESGEQRGVSEKHYDSIKNNMQKLTVSYQANDEFCQRISHLQNTISMASILIRSELLRGLESEWEELYNMTVNSRSVQRQHEVFQAATAGASLNKVDSDSKIEDDYELF